MTRRVCVFEPEGRGGWMSPSSSPGAGASPGVDAGPPSSCPPVVSSVGADVDASALGLSPGPVSSDERHPNSRDATRPEVTVMRMKVAGFPLAILYGGTWYLPYV